MMDKRELRRSARLQRIRMKEMHIPLHFGQIIDNEHASAQRQGGKNTKIMDDFELTIHGVTKEGHTPEGEVNPLHMGKVSRELTKTPLPSKMALEAILDLLQLKDSQGKLAMPANLEDENYEERTINPVDFGTMRAKLEEKRYRTLEQFEDDIYAVTTKVRMSNPWDDVIYGEVCSMEDLAKEIFKNLKIHSDFETELLNWLKDSIISNKKKQKLTTRKDSTKDAGDGREFNQPYMKFVHMEQSSMATGIASYEKPYLQNSNDYLSQNASPHPMAPPRNYGIAAHGNYPGKRTRTYKPWAQSAAANLHYSHQVAPVTNELEHKRTLLISAKPGDGHLLKKALLTQTHPIAPKPDLLKLQGYNGSNKYSSYLLPDIFPSPNPPPPLPTDVPPRFFGHVTFAASHTTVDNPAAIGSASSSSRRHYGLKGLLRSGGSSSSGKGTESFRLPDLGKDKGPDGVTGCQTPLKEPDLGLRPPTEFQFFPPSSSRGAKSMNPLDWLFSPGSGPSGVGSRAGSGQLITLEDGEPNFNWSDSLSLRIAPSEPPAPLKSGLDSHLPPVQRHCDNSSVRNGSSGGSPPLQVDRENEPGPSSELTTTLDLFR